MDERFDGTREEISVTTSTTTTEAEAPETQSYQASQEVLSEPKKITSLITPEPRAIILVAKEEVKDAGEEPEEPAEEPTTAKEQPAAPEQSTELTTAKEKAAEKKAPAKRGRPKKVQDEAAGKAPAKRGRPKKAETKKAKTTTEEKAHAKRGRPRKAAAAPAPIAAPRGLVIQSPLGGEITPEEIYKKIKKEVKGVNVPDSIYVRVDENAAFWVKGRRAGSVKLWD